MRIYQEQDLKSNVMLGVETAIVGYGNQGHAHALNLRDSGARVVVGARPGGTGWQRAERDGFSPLAVTDAVASADYVVLLLPDEIQGELFDTVISPRLKKGATLVFAHGFAVAFGVIRPPAGHDVLLAAPKGQGHFLRATFQKGHGIPCLVAVGQNASGHALEKVLSYAQMLGCLRIGAIETTFREEAITDLFGEQTVLCGGVPALVKTAFETLVKSGYSPEVAYIECLHELKIIADLMYRGGIAHMRDRISRTAAWGSFVAEAKIATPELRSTMKAILDAIESGDFASGWQREAAGGQEHLSKHIEREAQHPIENAGLAVRELMPYLKEEDS